jgi:hypothetical protein
MSKRGFGLLLVLVFFSLSLSGCYYFSAKKEMNEAQGLLTELKNAGGPAKVPYEYCSAEKFLEISRLEFDESDYGHAKGFAGRSKAASQAGLAEVKKK